MIHTVPQAERAVNVAKAFFHCDSDERPRFDI
jgi:hypothetical protein